MNISKRVFTYPVLSEEKNDYKTSKFDIDFSYNTIGAQYLCVDVNVVLDNDSIINSIQKGEAQIFLHVECTTSGFRKMYELSVSKNNLKLEISKLNGAVAFVGLVLTTKDILDFYSDDFQDDYYGMKFNLPKASIVAYKNIEVLTITKKMEEFKNVDSIFSILKITTDEDVPMEIGMNSPKITLHLGQVQHAFYSNNYPNQHYQEIFNTLLIFPALVYVFQELKIEGEMENYENREWFIALERNYQERGMDFREEVMEKDAFKLAQEIMQLPIIKSFEHLPLLNKDSGGSEDED